MGGGGGEGRGRELACIDLQDKYWQLLGDMVIF